MRLVLSSSGGNFTTRRKIAAITKDDSSKSSRLCKRRTWIFCCKWRLAPKVFKAKRFHAQAANNNNIVEASQWLWWENSMIYQTTENLTDSRKKTYLSWTKLKFCSNKSAIPRSIPVKEIPIKSTGHDKVRLTVTLTYERWLQLKFKRRGSNWRHTSVLFN